MVCRITALEMEQANQPVNLSRDSYVALQKNLTSLFRTSLQPLLSTTSFLDSHTAIP